MLAATAICRTSSVYPSCQDLGIPVMTYLDSARPIRCGTAFSAGPISMISFGPLMDTSVVLTCMTTAPDANATSGKSAAGRTPPEVPIESKASHCRAARLAVFHAPGGRSSPNHTIPGRKRPLHRRQRGGSINAPPLGGSEKPAVPRHIDDRQNTWGASGCHGDEALPDSPHARADHQRSE